ncbi:glycosyltransferase family 2 protein [Flavobacterium columnare]|uniref:glycosyltransferase family 2 protein n=1 Tax=Flavobacterium columnare TaxID=996 RepID=UPI000981B5F4|nr:glycosyltransferase family A protein [Flavobacterium columnare]OOB81782.1 glycosyl transferase [Flavobacterium columnare]
MIIICHKRNVIKKVFDFDNQKTIELEEVVVSKGILKLAERFSDRLLLWCHEDVIELLNVFEIKSLFHHNKMMMSYNPIFNYLSDAIGYVDESIFINVNKEVTYPTWQMSGLVGGINAEILLALKDDIMIYEDFEYFLNSLAKNSMPQGVICYSESKLLTNKNVKYTEKASSFVLFKFVKQHYKTRWIFLLLLNILIYERRFLLLPFLNSLFYNKIKFNGGAKLNEINIKSSKKVIKKRELDVIIPTIGRKSYLYDVLKDFSKQTILPRKIVIVEQNPELGSVSELDYITNEIWPFTIDHVFIHQIGVCNARNLALKRTESEWVFLADDDNRFDLDLIEKIFNKIELYGVEALITSYLQKGEIKLSQYPIQSSIFGAGNSFVKREFLETIEFNKGMEFGYGEDADFGMQIRNQGVDVVYFPEIEIEHLKAPIGGFRIKPVLGWNNDKIKPKPSPTVLLFRLLYHTREQILGYKTVLFLKFYKVQNIKNPLAYFLNFKKQWKISEKWAEKLKENEI